MRFLRDRQLLNVFSIALHKFGLIIARQTERLFPLFPFLPVSEVVEAFDINLSLAIIDRMRTLHTIRRSWVEQHVNDKLFFHVI